jgi:uncharacterized protein (UPF0128 family)
MTTWDNNHIQFCRLLAEIRAVSLTTEQYDQLQESMDLGYEDIDEVFARAEIEWMRVKDNKPVRQTTPEDEIEEFLDGSAI